MIFLWLLVWIFRSDKSALVENSILSLSRYDHSSMLILLFFWSCLEFLILIRSIVCWWWSFLFPYWAYTYFSFYWPLKSTFLFDRCTLQVWSNTLTKTIGLGSLEIEPLLLLWLDCRCLKRSQSGTPFLILDDFVLSDHIVMLSIYRINRKFIEYVGSTIMEVWSFILNYDYF